MSTLSTEPDLRASKSTQTIHNQPIQRAKSRFISINMLDGTGLPMQSRPSDSLGLTTIKVTQLGHHALELHVLCVASILHTC